MRLQALTEARHASRKAWQRVASWASCGQAGKLVHRQHGVQRLQVGAAVTGRAFAH